VNISSPATNPAGTEIADAGDEQTGKRIYDWFEQRLQVEDPIKDAVLHKVPRNTASWWYVFGSAAFTLLMLQIVTGILAGAGSMFRRRPRHGTV